MMVGWQQLLIILVIVLIVFGPGRLPDVFKKAGEGIKAFKDASEGKGDGKSDAKEAKASDDDDEYEEVVVRRKKKPAQIGEDDLDDAAGGEREKTGSAERKA